MISYNDALEIIKNEFEKLPLHTEEVDLLDSINCILAEDIISDLDAPSFDSSAMDGFAIQFSERKKWAITGEIAAGNYSSITLSENDAVLVTTGSKIPNSADTVIPVEDVDVEGNILQLKRDAFIRKGMNIRIKGNDLQNGQTAIQRFTKIDSKVIAVLACCGKEKVKVFKKLTVAILATGDELIPISEIPIDDKIRVSNTYSLFAAVRAMNHNPVMLGLVKDDKEIMRQKIKAAFEMNIDILMTTGSVSVGKYDFLKDLFEDEGVNKKFWRVNIKPGKPLYFGVYQKEEKRIFTFGLPGNPVSSLVTFNVFIKRAIDYIFQQTQISSITATLQNDLKKNDGKRHFSRGNLLVEKCEWVVTSDYSQSSGNLVEMSHANCLIIIEEEKRNPAKGEKVECIPI